MSSIMGDRIRTRRVNLGLTLREVADRVGCTHSTLGKWERGEISSMKASNLKGLAKALECSPLWLLGDNRTSLDTTPNIEPLPETEPVPVIGEIACGDPITAEENWDGLVDAPVEAGADFALRARGDSMINARIFPGDIVLVRQQPDVDSGEIAAVLIDGEATLKRIYKYEERVELRPENPTHRVIHIEGSDLASFRILGKAITFYSRVR